MQNEVILSYCKMLVACPISLEHKKNISKVLSMLSKEVPLDQMPLDSDELNKEN